MHTYSSYQATEYPGYGPFSSTRKLTREELVDLVHAYENFNMIIIRDQDKIITVITDTMDHVSELQKLVMQISELVAHHQGDIRYNSAENDRLAEENHQLIEKVSSLEATIIEMDTRLVTLEKEHFQDSKLERYDRFQHVELDDI